MGGRRDGHCDVTGLQFDARNEKIPFVGYLILPISTLVFPHNAFLRKNGGHYSVS